MVDSHKVNSISRNGKLEDKKKRTRDKNTQNRVEFSTIK